MGDRLQEIVEGHLGTRNLVAFLENSWITCSQQASVATAIVLHSSSLATAPNGAPLLAWLFDTSTLPSRYSLVLSHFIPHLPVLCTHKLASINVLRIVNQDAEPEASARISEALFQSPDDRVLTEILKSKDSGVAVVYKILTSRFLDSEKRSTYVEATKRVLIRIAATTVPAYRNLINEVGLRHATQGVVGPDRPDARHQWHGQMKTQQVGVSKHIV